MRICAGADSFPPYDSLCLFHLFLTPFFYPLVICTERCMNDFVFVLATVAFFVLGISISRAAKG